MDFETILQDPAWLPHRYDEAQDSFRFVLVPRASHRAATFLTDQHLAGVDNFTAIPRAMIDPARLPAAPVHFVFHSAYCCSTLIARMFDAEGLAMGLKEPVLLNDMVGWRRRGAEPSALAKVLDLSLSLLSRPFSPGEAVIVKPSSIVNSLAPAILGLRPRARAVLLYAPIEEFLASIAVKGLWGRQWARKALIGQINDDVVSHRFSAEELLELTDLQIAGLGWLSHRAIFAGLERRFGKERMTICDSPTLLRDPSATVRSFFAHMGMRLGDDQVRAIAASEAFTTNSKDRLRYSGKARDRTLAKTRRSHADEIAMVAAWVRHMATGIGIDADPPVSNRLFASQQ